MNTQKPQILDSTQPDILSTQLDDSTSSDEINPKEIDTVVSDKKINKMLKSMMSDEAGSKLLDTTVPEESTPQLLDTTEPLSSTPQLLDTKEPLSSSEKNKQLEELGQKYDVLIREFNTIQNFDYNKKNISEQEIIEILTNLKKLQKFSNFASDYIPKLLDDISN